MQVVYEIMRSLLAYIYGLFAAFLMYSPAHAEQGQDLYAIVRAFLTDPCTIRNGVLGLLLLPENAYVVGLVMAIAGVAYMGYAIIQMFGRAFGEAFSAITSTIRSVIYTLRIGGWRYGRGGRMGGWGYDRSEYGLEYEGHAGMSALTVGLGLVLIGAILAAGSQQQSGAIASVVTALGSLLSGVFMVVVSGFVQVANTIIAAALGANAIPICGP